jgi:hypothetical protein
MRLLAFTTIAMLMLIGCHSLLHRKKKEPPPPATAPTPIIERTDTEFHPPAAPNLPVKQGPPPLVYMVEAGGAIRVVETETGATVAEVVAPPGSIVSIDEKAGVRIGQEWIVKGPLVAGRTYQIFLEGPDENVFSNQRIRPGKP